MPEGPDLHLASRFIQTVCQGRYFSGKVKKSEISKCPPVNWDAELYSITATARGKEIKLTLTEILQGQKNKDKPLTKSKLSGIKSEVKTLDILFRFGLAGRFRFDPVDDIQKHAHLNFYTKDGKMVLSYVDYMRFGTWEPNGQWGAHRGPCVLMEYDQFRCICMLLFILIVLICYTYLYQFIHIILLH
jgi:endonuclease VIII-like 1